jgi:hypothetical protein
MNPSINGLRGGLTKMLEVRLNNFQVQDKLALIEALKDKQLHPQFEIAVHQFVDNFGRAYSVDAPYPKRIGRWIGLHASADMISRLVAWSQTPAQVDKVAKYRAEFREALEVASKIDRSTRPKMNTAA